MHEDPTAEVHYEEEVTVQVATPASKLDAMFTFLKINFSSLWGDEPKDEKQFEAKVYKRPYTAVVTC